MPRDRVVVSCPAKVNLYLSVGPRDSRGYHPISTVFQAISLADTLEVSRSDADSFECNAVLPARNTVTRAWSLLREVLPVPKMRVRLTKRIPVEAGLGGGSSDGAAMIRAVEALTSARIPDGERSGLALALGADVPFFLMGGLAVGEGYGERLQALPDTPENWMVVAKPAEGCSTKEMYEALDAESRCLRSYEPTAPMANDFEAVAPDHCLALKNRLVSLGATEAMLSGSGSSVFGVFADQQEAALASKRLGGERYVVRTITRSESLRVETA